jgi:hypothetical protein
MGLLAGAQAGGESMLLTDEIGGEVYSVGEVRLSKPVITVRELIGVRVDLVGRFNQFERN